ncbi:fatty acid hydroxylase domain-containing protein 2-like [Sycon ciliatum]|uniref:fatty acid hydroxylase domain-containing protein 2-like n=1 Tax=Sycon ciliatum TaxID=27933 RepID=UPI0020A87CA1|eukprot:scpid68382/ scgid9807/ Uncharacterized protein C5orf4
MASEEVLHSFTMPAAEAVRNTTLGALAGAGTDLQDTWTWVYTEWAGEDALFLWTVFFLITSSFFWIFNLGFNFLELTGQPAYLLKYRIQLKQKPAVVDRAVFFKCVRTVLHNQLAIGIPFHYCLLPLLLWRGGLYDRALPSLPYALFDLAMCSLAIEVGFYYTHRLLHLPYFYRKYHKIHHEWRSPISISSIYCHPFEYWLSNLLPLVAGPILMGSHFTTAMFWVMLSTASGSIAHCGYHLPLLPSNETHDYHHSQFNQIYGPLGILDTLHGTNRRFKASVHFLRHFTLTGSTPAYVLVPDKSSKDEQTVTE